MALLDTHLEQIELCANTISELPFPPPGIFTNALLYLPDITALIRDPDTHETALFSAVPPADFSSSAPDSKEISFRRSTIFDISDTPPDGNAAFRGPRKNAAVAAVLGGEMAERIRRERAGDNPSNRRKTGTAKDEIDIELLLKGAEKLCKVYPMSGALDRITAIRTRHDKVTTSLRRYERLVEEQTEQLKRISRSTSFGEAGAEFEESADDTMGQPTIRLRTHEDMKREEEGIKELERRKRTLEDRVSGMKKDLGGILR